MKQETYFKKVGEIRKAATGYKTKTLNKVPTIAVPAPIKKPSIKTLPTRLPKIQTGLKPKRFIA